MVRRFWATACAGATAAILLALPAPSLACCGLDGWFSGCGTAHSTYLLPYTAPVYAAPVAAPCASCAHVRAVPRASCAPCASCASCARARAAPPPPAAAARPASTVRKHAIAPCMKACP